LAARSLALIAVLALSAALARAELAEVAILHTNDLHGQLDRAEALIATLHALREKHPASIQLDAGDAFESKLPGSVASGGREIVDFLNRAGYDGFTPGDNEFVDYRLSDVLANLKRLAFPALSANLRVNGEPIALPYFVYTRGGARLAVIGVYGDHKSLARFGVEELSVRRVVQPLVAALTGKVDCIVLLSHSGAERERGFAREIRGIDVIVGGSTHAARDPEVVNGTVIVRAQARGAAVGLLVLEIDTDQHRVKKWRFERVETGTAVVSPDPWRGVPATGSSGSRAPFRGPAAAPPPAGRRRST
jgi:2',3'-cyclic-nucleotide 2'-phosphodiesterase (5'-nucleotidase family)